MNSHTNDKFESFIPPVIAPNSSTHYDTIDTDMDWLKNSLINKSYMWNGFYRYYFCRICITNSIRDVQNK